MNVSHQSSVIAAYHDAYVSSEETQVLHVRTAFPRWTPQRQADD